MSIGSTISRRGSIATVAELAQRVEAMERYLSGGIGPVDLAGALSNGAVDLGGPAQRWRRIYADGLTVGATDIDLTRVAQQLAATSPVIFTTAGNHDATAAITTLAFLVLGAGGQGGGGGGAWPVESGGSGANGIHAAVGGAIVQRARSTDSIVVTIGDGGDGGAASTGHYENGAIGSVGANTIVTVGGVARVTLAGGIGGGGGWYVNQDLGSQAGRSAPPPVPAGPGAGGIGGDSSPTTAPAAGTKGGPGFCVLIPVTPAA